MLLCRFKTCCGCVSLKAGIVTLGIIDLFLLLGAALNITIVATYGPIREYEIISNFVLPPLLLLPVCAVFLYGWCGNFTLR